jgi:hypothetical protein
MKRRSDNEDDPWKNAERLRRDAMIEFAFFKELAPRKRILQAMQDNGFEAITSRTSFMVMDKEEDRLQISLGKRKPPFPNLKGNSFLERGASLVYSRSEFGNIAIIISPCESDMAEMEETHIFIGLGRFTGHQLSARLERDLRHLLRYHYVSSIGLVPTRGQRLWPKYMRWCCPTGTENGFKISKRQEHLQSATSFVGSTVGTIVLQPLLTALIVTLMLYFGLGDYVASILPGG